jgi:hypothetical protein
MDTKILHALARKQRNIDAALVALEAKIQQAIEKPQSITEEIDSIPGRRIFYHLSDRQNFDATKDGLRGDPLTFLVSQDGPFIMTHYPLVIWKANEPSNATNFGRWRPVSTWPLSDQILDTDIVDLSYEMLDSGSQRNFQNEPAGPIFSRPDNFVPLPVPTLFAPNSTINFFPTWENIAFATAGTATTGGELLVTLPGMRVANM